MQHRLDWVLDRLHILEGLLVIYLNIDEVINIIRNEDEPKKVLQKKFKLSVGQVDAILEIRLRQLAKLEEIKQAVATAETSKGQARPGRTETDIDALVEEKVQEILVRDLPRLVRDELLALKEAASVLADTPSATPAAIPPASQAAAPDRKRRTRKTSKG